MTTHENNGIQGSISKKGRAQFSSAFFIVFSAIRFWHKRTAGSSIQILFTNTRPSVIRIIFRIACPQEPLAAWGASLGGVT
jgi:hypothetical protein